MKCFKTYLLVGIFLAFCSTVRADIPKQINFQGILKDSLGNPYPDGNYSITFRIYDNRTGGNVLWQEADVFAISGGLFTHLLGSAIAIPESAFTDSLRWLGVQVAGNPEITPRAQLISVPYAFQSLRSDSAAVATLSLDLTCNGCVDANDLAANSVGTSEIVATEVQRRVTGTAPVGEYITAINQDGSVVTAVDQAGTTNGWTDDGAVVRLSTGTDNVGIGTTAPGAKLDVDGGIIRSFFSHTNDMTPSIYVRNGASALTPGTLGTWGTFSAVHSDGTESKFGILGTAGGSQGSKYGVFGSATGGGTNWAGYFVGNVEISERLGIGELSPINKLDIEGGVAIGSAYSGTNTAPSNGLIVEGNVGIGTTNPTALLNLRAPTNTNQLHLERDALFGGGLRFKYLGTTDGWEMWSGDQGGIKIEATGFNKIRFFTNSGEQMRIDPSGNVGIGTTVPSSKLHVREDLDGNHVLIIDNQSTGTTSAQGIYFNSEDGTGTNGAAILAFDNSHPTAPATLRIVNNVSGGKIDFNTGLQTRLTISNAGDVGIGTASPAAKLHVNGTAGNNTGVWSNLSDLRLKRDIEPIEGALETVEQLQGVSFRWKDAEKDTQFGRVRGLIAQDVEKVIPEWIKTDPDGYKRLEPIGVDALLIEAIKEQQKQIEELKAEVLKLKKGSPQAQAEN